MEAEFLVFLTKVLEHPTITDHDVNDFRQLLHQSRPGPHQIAWIRDHIFSVGKDILSKQKGADAASKTFDNVHTLISTLEFACLQPAPNVRMALFFPDDETSFDHFYRLLSDAKRSLDICVFTITDDRVSHLIQKAHDRGVVVRLVTDDEKAEDLGADVHTLKSKGIPVRIDNSPAFMHHKFCIIDDTILLNGSFNWTRSAATKNNENVAVLDDPVLISLFKKEFERLWSKFGPLQDGPSGSAAQAGSNTNNNHGAATAGGYHTGWGHQPPTTSTSSSSGGHAGWQQDHQQRHH